jgi:hypothetical protein
MAKQQIQLPLTALEAKTLQEILTNICNHELEELVCKSNAAETRMDAINDKLRKLIP